MEKKEICIDSASIYGKLFSESGYSSLARSAMGVQAALADVMLITEDEKRIIDTLIRSSINEVVHTIGRFLGSCSAKYCIENEDGKGEYRISFTAPYNYPDEQLPIMKECIEDLVFSRTLQQWYMTVKPDEAGITAVKTQDYAIQLRELLSKRKRPTATRNDKENIIEL